MTFWEYAALAALAGGGFLAVLRLSDLVDGLTRRWEAQADAQRRAAVAAALDRIAAIHDKGLVGRADTERAARDALEQLAPGGVAGGTDDAVTSLERGIVLLERLARLRTDGVLTDAEFARQKVGLLVGIECRRLADLRDGGVLSDGDFDRLTRRVLDEHGITPPRVVPA